jgi:hypothetical protein
VAKTENTVANLGCCSYRRAQRRYDGGKDHPRIAPVASSFDLPRIECRADRLPARAAILNAVANGDFVEADLVDQETRGLARPVRGFFVFHSHPSSRASARRAALQGNPSAFAGDSSAFERVDFLYERQAMTRAFSDIDDIGGTPHLVENRFRLNGAAAIFEIIHTQEFPVRQFEGQENSVFCICRHFHSC